MAGGGRVLGGGCLTTEACPACLGWQQLASWGEVAGQAPQARPQHPLHRTPPCMHCLQDGATLPGYRGQLTRHGVILLRRGTERPAGTAVEHRRFHRGARPGGLYV